MENHIRIILDLPPYIKRSLDPISTFLLEIHTWKFEM